MYPLPVRKFIQCGPSVCVCGAHKSGSFQMVLILKHGSQRLLLKNISHSLKRETFVGKVGSVVDIGADNLVI